MLGLADQVGGDVRRVGCVVGQDGDLGRAGLGVDADDAAQQPLGGGDPDVARPGDHVDRVAVRGALGVDRRAVRQHRDGLGAADGVDLVDTQQGAGGEHPGVGQAAVLLLRRARHHQRAHPGRLGRHHVHHHGRRIHRQAAGDVEADPVDRHPALGHRAARHHLGGVVGAALVGVHLAGPRDRLQQRGAHLGSEGALRLGDRLGGHPQHLGRDPVEALTGLPDRRVTMLPDRLHEGADPLDGHGDVELGTGQQAARVTDAAAQVDPVQHPCESRRPARTATGAARTPGR